MSIFIPHFIPLRLRLVSSLVQRATLRPIRTITMAASTAEDTTSQRFKDQWLEDDIAAKYARAENATRPFAEIMVQKARVGELTGEARILDVATGTGAVIAALHTAVGKEKLATAKIVAGDISDSMLAYVQKRGEKEGWKGVDVRKVDGVVSVSHRLPSPQNEIFRRSLLTPKQKVGTDETFTHIFINFAIFVLPIDSLEQCFKLLQPNGFVTFSSWAFFPWYPMIERAHARLSNAPPLSSYETIKDRIYQGRSWNADQIREELQKANFEDVEVVQKKEVVSCGTPAQFAETMAMPLMIVVGGWPEEDRDRLRKEMLEAFEEVGVEEAGGKQSTITMEFEGIVGMGWKA